MVNFDEDALICDLAETYHIFDYRLQPLNLVATLSAGLKDDSRIKMKMANIPVSQEILLLASIADRIEFFRYGFADSKNTDKPTSIVESLYGVKKGNKNGIVGFDSAEEFKATLAKLRG